MMLDPHFFAKKFARFKKVLYLCGVLEHYYTMININNITYSYPGNPTPVFSDFSLTINPGGIYGLLGANGTGKSTLLYCIAGLLKPAQGSVDINGTETFHRLPSTLSEIFLVPEEFDMPAIPLADFVKQNAKFYPRFSVEQLGNYLSHFRLTPDIHLGRLSMGQRKKAFIAFALACNTSVLLMDEPTNGLDIPGKVEFRRAVISAMTDERTIIISTHQVRDLDRVLDHLVMISPTGVVLDRSIASLQRDFQFIFTQTAADSVGALWVQPAPGGFNIIRPRVADMDETDVNLESLFEFAFSNPEIFKQS